MIKINLVPTVVSSGGDAGASSPTTTSIFGNASTYSDDISKEALKRLLVIFLGPLGLIIYENQNIPELEARLNAKQAEINQISEHISKHANSAQEIKKFKDDEALIENRISELKKISESRVQEIKIMEIVQSNVPEQLWLNELSISRDSIVMRGHAVSENDITAFQEALTQQKIIKEIKPGRSESVKKDGIELKSFAFECFIEGNNE